MRTLCYCPGPELQSFILERAPLPAAPCTVLAGPAAPGCSCGGGPAGGSAGVAVLLAASAALGPFVLTCFTERGLTEDTVAERVGIIVTNF